MKVSKSLGILRIELPIETPRPSASGKTMLIASSHGVKRTNVFVKRKEISIVVNAFVYPEMKTRKKNKKEPQK